MAGTLPEPGGLLAACTRRPFSVAAFRLVRGLWSDGWSFVMFIDVGDNIGQFARASLGEWPGSQVVAFEPQAELAARLQATVGQVGTVEVHAIALGAEDGTTPFFRHNYDLSSSVLPVADDGRDGPWARQLPPMHVSLRRLDTDGAPSDDPAC